MAANTPNHRNHVENHRISDDELRSSIAKFGCFLPILRWQNRTLDGHRRERIALGVGKTAQILQLRTRREAASALWMVHPERAIITFPEPTLRAAAELYGTTPAQVAMVRRSLRGGKTPYQHQRVSWTRRRAIDHAPFQTDGKALKIQFWLSPELREAMRLARVRGDRCSEAAFIRRAIVAALEINHPPSTATR